MTSIDGLFAILEDRGLMPAVALFSLSAVLGLLYLSSGNPTSDRTWMPGIPCAVTWPVFRFEEMTLNRAWTAYLPRFPVTRVPR